jgi:hypothetical protein
MKQPAELIEQEIAVRLARADVERARVEAEEALDAVHAATERRVLAVLAWSEAVRRAQAVEAELS